MLGIDTTLKERYQFSLKEHRHILDRHEMLVDVENMIPTRWR